MDETLMAFNLLSNITIEQTDTKTVSILSTEHKRSNFTVILIRNIYNNWMSEAIKNYISCGKIKRPFYSLVVRWIKEGWDAIDINMIRQSFKYCGVLNAMNGTEDTLIFDFDRLEHKVRREDPERKV
ncbi:hypothetical protein RhiirA5_486334 [Rhizophagus irregularis]|uniref:DDE-1 domain-containing protein n=1 Tax=Rhizophagus irregularis TaxID=588596 RepID=A0A2N0PE72_9GLOM|nr:hypothetical protein RhiirA5_486334 [Rhizophagus irregularis]